MLTTEYLVLDGIRTRAVSRGRGGPVVLFLHGYTDSADTWESTFAALRGSDLRCVAIDLPSHGRADALRRPIVLSSLDDFVAAAVRTFDQGDGVVLVGNSLGGMLSLRAAASGALPVSGVLALGAPDRRLHPMLERLPAVGGAVERLLGVPVLPSAVLGRLAAQAYTLMAGTKAPAAYRTHLDRRRLRELITVGAAVIGELHCSEDEELRGPPNGDVPGLRVWGDRDRICPVEPDTRGRPGVRILEGLGHCPQVERPELVAGLVHEVVALVDASTPTTLDSPIPTRRKT